MSPAVPERLRRLLRGLGCVWTAPIEHHEVIGSTSDRLKELAAEGAAEWSVVLADRQTAGRGRHGRHWVSPVGNLYLSTLLRPRFAAERVGLVPLVAGVALAEALAGFGVSASLKWPNDLVAAGKKLAGVLAEAGASGGRVETIVVGVGVNIAADPGQLPAELRACTTSVAAEGGRTEDRLGVAAAVLARLRAWKDRLATKDTPELIEAWRARSVPWWGRGVEVRSGMTTIRGVARGVDAAGSLVLELPDGRLESVIAGEVRELRLE
jgi:BirA family biotin operon repressor/biotin-[acetyl-CoA-carboxylase] ligase